MLSVFRHRGHPCLAWFACLSVCAVGACIVLGALKGHHIAHSVLQGGVCVWGGIRYYPKPCVDLSGNLAVQVIEIITGASLIGEPAVHRHVLLLHLADEGLVRFPLELFDAVTLADVRAQVNQGLIGGISHLIGVLGVTGNLNSDCPVVVACGGRTPGAVFFLHIHADAAIIANAIVGACLSGCRGKHIAQGFHAALTYHTMDGDGVNFVVSGTCLVWGNFGIVHQFAVTQCYKPPFQSFSTISAKRMAFSTPYSLANSRTNFWAYFARFSFLDFHR